ncbi:GRAS domain-containing protein [Psidium guajava]|nr:GRAS domain-containing protein [Psidium guajava]
MEEAEDQEELLNLSLAIVSSGCGDEARLRKRKRKRSMSREEDNDNVVFSSSDAFEGCEDKVFKLLQTREEMLGGAERRRSKQVHPHHEDGKGLHLIHLLLITATAVDESNAALALDNLAELYRTVSLTGDSVQRVVAYFAEGLTARLLTRKSPFHDMIMKRPTREEEFVAFTYLYRVSPYYQFAHFTANQAILEAFEREEQVNHRALHVVDFDVSYGFQWPSLIQSLSEKATSGNKISLRITGFGRSPEELQETEGRLVSFSKGFKNVVLEFQGLLRGSKLVNLRKKKQETVAVNLVFHLNMLSNFTKISETLKSVHSLKPSIVMLMEQEGNRSPRSFLSRFTESLHYFAAMFDSLDDCLPLESSERLSIEKNHLGKEIKTRLNHEKEDGRMEMWKGRMETHGFAGVKLSSRCMIQARLLLRIRAHHRPLQFEGENSGFRVIERDEGRAISLGWQDRSLITASAWHCVW